MRLFDLPVASQRERNGGIVVLSLVSRELARTVQPGQFVNIRVDNSYSPLLRRPFSISRIKGDEIEILFNIVGRGTALLASKEKGDRVDVLGPLGVPFNVEGDYDTAIIVAGGLGVAPFPLLTERLVKNGKKIKTFLGARNKDMVSNEFLQDVEIATDDGSAGFHGTVVKLLEKSWDAGMTARTRIFGCGPTRMLKALSEFAVKAGVSCQISLEGDMACGIGICQGCPVRRSSEGKKYSLVCTDGPTFNCSDVILE